MSKLSDYLTGLEEKVVEQGGRVIWAQDARQAVEFILDLAHRKGIRQVIKGKSMLCEEMHLNEALERARVHPVETDLGEYII